MKEIFKMKLTQMQPSQLYISCKKLDRVMKMFGKSNNLLEPIPIKKLGNEIVIVDGHTRALAAFLHNLKEVEVYWEEEKLDWDAYRICVEWCKNEGIYTIADLKNKVISQREYEKLWLKRCAEMQKELSRKRRLQPENKL